MDKQSGYFAGLLKKHHRYANQKLNDKNKFKLIDRILLLRYYHKRRKHNEALSGRRNLNVKQRKQDMMKLRKKWLAAGLTLLFACACMRPQMPAFAAETDMPMILAAESSGRGYLSLYDLCRTAERADYPGLSDAEFANFRMVTAGTIGEGILYRSSSPVDPTLGRNAYADREAEKAGIRTVLNLAENRAVAESYPGYAETYYSGCDIYFADMTTAYASDSFRCSMTGTLRFLCEHDGPYLIHCMEGKLRTGVTCALLECLMGAELNVVQDDFAVTYQNYYHVAEGIKQPVPEELEPTIRSLIVDYLALLFHDAPDAGDDLAGKAEAYIRELGFTDSEIAQIRQNLSGETDAEATEPPVSEIQTETTVSVTTVPETTASETAQTALTDAPPPKTGDSGSTLRALAAAALLFLNLRLIRRRKKGQS